MSQQIFQNQAAREQLEAWYQRFLKKLPVPAESRTVTTSHGASHVLLVGDRSKPVLVVLHGSLASSAHVATELGELLQHFYVVAPDLPGQSVRGPEKRLPLKDDSLARWLLEVLDGLGIQQFNLLGVSWGGFVALQTALNFPQRISRLALLVPAGLVRGSSWAALTQIGVPFFLYKLAPTEARLRKFLKPIFTTFDDDWMGYMGDAMRNFVLDWSVPPLAKDDNLRKLQMPLLVIGASEDIHFRGGQMVERVKRLLPHAETELIANARHSPPLTDEFRAWLSTRLMRFLA